jgi:tetratricopeptide (TPR) repeat protein
VRWSTTVAAWTRREAVLVAALAVAAGVAALAAPLHAPWLVVAGAAVGAAGALARGVIAVAGAHLEGRQERAELARRLQVPVAPVGEIDPTLVGVDPAAQTILPGGRVPAYVGRAVDAVVREAVTAGLRGAGPWLVVVIGPSKAGKSRTLLEALRQCAPPGGLPLVAPAGGEALRALLVPGQDLRLGQAPAVLWLDDLEPFLNEGVTLQTLREWHAGGPGRIVAATYGGKGSEQIAGATVTGVATVAAGVLAHAREIPLAITSPAELGELGGQLDDAQLQAIGRHGLAAFLVAGRELERKLTTGLHALGERACPEGVALVYAAVDWARCGRTDPIGADTLRRLWPAYLSAGLRAADDAFAAALTWALEPVAGTISLLQSAGSYVPYDYVVRLVDTRPGASPPLSHTWDAAIQTATEAEAFAVGIAAYLFGLLDEAATAFDRARGSSIGQIAAVAGNNLGIVLLQLVRREEAVAAYDQVLDRYGDDPALREQVARALVNKGATLGGLGRPEEAVAAFDLVLDRYGDDPAPALREQTAMALVNKGARLGFMGRQEEAVAAYDQVLDRYGDDPALREQAATALFYKGVRLGFMGRPEEAVAAYDQVLDRYGDDPAPALREVIERARRALAAPALREQAARALVYKGEELGELGRLEEAVAAFDQVLDRYGDDPAPALREEAAMALVNKGAALGELGRPEEAVAAYDQVLARYGDDPAPALRGRAARALVYKGIRLDVLGRLEEAVAAYDQVLDRYGDDPALREQAARALVNKGLALGQLGRQEEAVAAYDLVLVRYGDDPALREQAANALYDKGVRLGVLGRLEEAVAAYDQVLARYGDDLAPAAREVIERARKALAETSDDAE